MRGTNTYYQWGRKDPMCPAEYNGAHTVFKQLFPCDSWSYQLYTAESIGTAIQHPNTLYAKKLSSAHFWYDPKCYGTTTEQLFNLWDNKIPGMIDWSPNGPGYVYDPPVKTVYDPSPAGYCVPPNGAFSGFTYNATHNLFAKWEDLITNCVQQDNRGVTSVHGFLIYCMPMPATGEWDDSAGLYFLSLGAQITVSDNEVYPSGLGLVMQIGSTSCCPGKQVYAPQASLVIGLLRPRDSTSSAQGVSLRPIREE